MLFFVHNKNGDYVKIRLGYACISKTLDNVTTSTNYTLTKFMEEKNMEKLENTIMSNFQDLEKIIDYNIKNNIHFYRLSSKIISLATIDDINIDYSKFNDICTRIGDKINKYDMRVDIHPDQFCVLNSMNKDIVLNSYKIINYHYKLLDMLKIKNKVIILHVGSSAGSKKASITRFINNLNKLDKDIKNSIIIENDDKVYNILDCLKICKKTNLRMVLDYHHYICNSGNVDINNYLESIFLTWKDDIPKIHFSSPKNNTKKDMRSHHEYINSDKFIEFLNILKKYDQDVDIMIEAKGKDEALFKLVRELKYKTNYQFIDDTSFII